MMNSEQKRNTSGASRLSVGVDVHGWIDYLKATENYDSYDAMCECHRCNRIRANYENWRNNMMNHPKVIQFESQIDEICALKKEINAMMQTHNKWREVMRDLTLAFLREREGKSIPLVIIAAQTLLRGG